MLYSTTGNAAKRKQRRQTLTVCRLLPLSVVLFHYPTEIPINFRRMIEICKIKATFRTNISQMNTQLRNMSLLRRKITKC